MWKGDGSVKLVVYRKKHHINLYPDFNLHHPLHQKMGVVRTFLDRCDNIVADGKDKEMKQDIILKFAGIQDGSLDQDKIAKKEEKVTTRRAETWWCFRM